MENDITIKRFTDIRRDLGYTQAEFAELLGISNTTADIERGRTKLSGKESLAVNGCQASRFLG